MKNRSLNQWAERIGLQAAVVIAGVLIVFGGSALGERIGTREEADMPALTAAEPAEGIGRKPAVQRYLSGTEAEEAVSLPVYDEYVEGEGPAPVWWDPEEPMAAEWEDSSARQSEFNPIQRTDAGCPDWNVDSTLYGWNGHTAEAWEMDLFARIFYLEFWGTSDFCCEAGCDAMLRLWDSGLYGSTMGASLSALNDFGKHVYSTYPSVWNTVYDPDGLAWCRDFCEARFYAGPVNWVMYFQLGGYHDLSWSTPCFECDGVYFSAGKEW